MVVEIHPRMDVSIPPEVIAEVDRIKQIDTGQIGILNWPASYPLPAEQIITLTTTGTVKVTDITGTITDKTRYIASGRVDVANFPTDYFKAGQNVNVTSGLVEVVRLNPILKGSIFNTLIGANTNFFASDLTPTYSPTIFRIHITDDTAGLLNVKRTRGATTVTETLNGGSNLASGCAYIFDIVVESGDSINLQYSTTGTVLVCKVMEVGASA